MDSSKKNKLLAVNFLHSKQLATRVISAVALIGVLCNAQAAERGSSSYLQGTYGDFATGMLGPKGFYVRNDFLYYDASVLLHSLGHPMEGYVAQSIWGDLLKVAYISDEQFLGGRYNASIAVPILFGSQVIVNVPGRAPRIAADGNVSGIGDVYVTPAALGWDVGNHHLIANISFIAPSGEYDDARMLSPGRNYWSFDPTINYTWLHPQRGHEVTLTFGYMKNWENKGSRYTTGDELHLDWTIAQHLSEQLALGATGYWYKQVTNDSSAFPTGFSATDFVAHGAGIGATVVYTAKIADREVSFIAKWITDIAATNRLDGDVLTLSFAFKL